MVSSFGKGPKKTKKSPGKPGLHLFEKRNQKTYFFFLAAFFLGAAFFFGAAFFLAAFFFVAILFRI
jgi:VIT1/CCC1 family predicted Fe2+/Mn2+ transporter